MRYYATEFPGNSLYAYSNSLQCLKGNDYLTTPLYTLHLHVYNFCNLNSLCHICYLKNTGFFLSKYMWYKCNVFFKSNFFSNLSNTLIFLSELKKTCIQKSDNKTEYKIKLTLIAYQLNHRQTRHLVQSSFACCFKHLMNNGVLCGEQRYGIFNEKW